jgi:hypothetical protein
MLFHLFPSPILHFFFLKILAMRREVKIVGIMGNNRVGPEQLLYDQQDNPIFKGFLALELILGGKNEF